MDGTKSALAATAVNTVRGPMPVSEMGMTLMHEHLICDWSRHATEPNDRLARERYYAVTDPTMHWLLTEDPWSCLDNIRLDEAEPTVEELGQFAAMGGRTVVECTNADIGRNPQALRDISERSGLNVVMGSGWYVHPYHAPETIGLDIETLSAQLITEFTDGVEGTGIRPGIIGEIGVSPLFTEHERVRLRAAARAQRNLHVPMLIHLPGWQRRAHEVLDIVVDEERVRPEAVVLCHMDPSGVDPDYQRKVADRGVWLEFDMIGMSTYYAGEGQSPAPDQTAAAIALLVENGHGPQILLSHDLSVKSMWTRNGGNGFGYIPRLFLDRLERHGVPAEVTAGLLTANPAATFVAADGRVERQPESGDRQW
ncbi:aryldialkylphosphatase [Gordonia terrae]|uniref:Aryldialkylphosphatase n=1 Tax=Gordonia terrae TaxID=2055 RepID=A0A2I1R4S6_9ACTN|nr:aryldialkylphosphatase [Gordonia terrae]PKZ64130.1 aryldialkylphosphatase [Gordonia terrae]